MRLEWIEDILAVLDTGSLSRAADRRFVTQSAFTRRVRAIEAALGTELFDRSRKPVALTPGVLALEPELRRLAVQLRRMAEDLRRSAKSERRVISIACQHALATTLAAEVVGALTTDAQTVRMWPGNRDICLMQLLSGEADIAITFNLPGEQTPIFSTAFEMQSLGSDKLIPVSTPTMASVAARANIPIISYPQGTYLGQVLDTTVMSNLPEDVSLSLRAETALTLAMVQMVLDGHGMAWLPHSLIQSDLAQGRLVRYTPDFPEQELEIRMIRLADQVGATDDRLWARIAEFASISRGKSGCKQQICA